MVRRMEQRRTLLLVATVLAIAALSPGLSGAAQAGSPFAIRRAVAELDVVTSASGAAGGRLQSASTFVRFAG